MKKKWIAILLSVSMLATFTGCGNSDSSDPKSSGETKQETQDNSESDDADTSNTDSETEGDLGYQYGAGVTFHSDEPVSYSMMFSDHENYPSKEDWLLWQAIEEKTNVTFDKTLVARTDYNDKVTALVNAGDAPYIIPKIYDETPYVTSGQIVPISDYVQYMPNYMKCVEDWGMEDDLKPLLQSDGKYYRLPGLWEQAAGGYSLVIRKDVFEAAGIDVEKEEKEWTWETFYEALKKVKEHTGADYVWSDQYQGGSTMNIAGAVYNVKAGRSSDGGDWGLQNGTKFDWDKNQFFFTNTTDAYKEFLTYFNKLYTEKILDPETFTQDSETAQAKFYRGESYVLNVNYQQLADMISGNKMQVEGAELYMIVPPGGPAGQLQVESTRLENGIMISQNALDELGEEEFIKMLRFIDWLWYSDEGQTLSLWGVEGTTYTKDEEGKFVLNSDIYYNGINPGAEKQLNVDYGFGGGVFAYGGSTELRFSKFTEGESDYNNRVYDCKTPRKLDPPIMADELESEDLNLIKTPLMDYVSSSSLQFITGKMDLNTQWDEYVKQCESKGSTRYVDMANEIFEKTKSMLGFE